VAEKGDTGSRDSPEEAAKRVERRARELSEQTTRGLVRLIARTKEEVEDIWVEARARRERGDRER
jgi:hypothetical protein